MQTAIITVNTAVTDAHAKAELIKTEASTTFDNLRDIQAKGEGQLKNVMDTISKKCARDGRSHATQL